MIKNLLDNWKTTSAGLLSVATATVHLVFQMRSGHVDEGAWMTAITGWLIGVGLLAAGDAAKSKQDVKAVEAKVDQTAKAVVTGDTSILTNPQPPMPPTVS